MKLQSAIEYLVTYGWALLIIGIALAVLFALGVFNSATLAPQECIFPGGISCTNFYMSPNGIITLSILQATQSPINVTSIGCSDNPSAVVFSTINNPPSDQAYMPIGGSFTFSVQCYANGIPFNGVSGSLYEGYVIFNYTDEISGFPHTAQGQVSVDVS